MSDASLELRTRRTLQNLALKLFMVLVICVCSIQFSKIRNVRTELVDKNLHPVTTFRSAGKKTEYSTKFHVARSQPPKVVINRKR